MDRTDLQSNIFLKMDIEGSEYRVIDHILTYADRIIGMVVEFHDINILEEKFFEAVRKISAEYNIIHIHGNNYGGLGPSGMPNVLEMTFESKSLCVTSPAASRYQYPIPELDNPNNQSMADLILTFD